MAPSLLIITAEALQARMAGPAIRAWEMAHALADTVEVSIASLASTALTSDRVRVVDSAPEALRVASAGVDTVLVQGDVLNLAPWLADLPVCLVVDAYDPFHLEQLEQTRGADDAARWAVVRDCTTTLSRQLQRADFVLCASERQRALWLGHLAALGRVNPMTYDQDHSLRGLLDVVPFGIGEPPDPQPGRRGALRAHLPAIGPSDVVALWGGGLYDWFDPELVVRAAAGVAGLHLVFLDGRLPSASVSRRAADAARERARQLGTLGISAHFVDTWIPYAERVDWLGGADLGVVAGRRGLESEFAFRTRVLDHLWVGLPTVGTAGDALVDDLAAAGAAVAVPPGDEAALRAALEDLTRDGVRRADLAGHTRAVSPRYRWGQAVGPLRAFCQDPHPAPDRAAGVKLGAFAQIPPGAHGALAARLAAAWRADGPLGVTRRAARRLRLRRR